MTNYPRSFTELFLSEQIDRNLQKLKFVRLTPIQALTIPEMLQNRNVLAVAPTGSGKTLAFLIPIVQYMIENKVQISDGLQALILTPTRELAMQIFTVLQRIGNDVHLTCSLVCGGHSVQKESENLRSMNIIIATPGRILHHLGIQTGGFGDNLRFLVFDEVDQLLQMGFQDQLVQMASYFPYFEANGKQNMSYAFFTATINQRLEHLIKKFQNQITTVVAKEFTFAQLQDFQNASTKRQYIQEPEQLQQSLAQVQNSFSTLLRIQLPQLLPKNLKTVISTIHECDKFDVLYSFLNSYQNNKIIVFLSTCRQVNFFNEALRNLHPGSLILKLSGRLKQNQREAIFFRFVKATNALLLTTDIAARGLDCQSVDFVIQYDCFVDLQQFIHRAGRAARMQNNGVNVCFVSEQERHQLQLLQEAQIPFESRNMKLSRAMSVQQAVTMLLNKNEYVKACAEHALGAYSKFIYVSKPFDFDKYDFSGIAKSWGMGTYKLGPDIAAVSDSEDFVLSEAKTTLSADELQQVGAILDSAPVRHLMQFQGANGGGDYAAQIAQRGEQLKSEIGLTDQQDKRRYKDVMRKPKDEPEAAEAEAPQEEEFEWEEEFGEEEAQEAEKAEKAEINEV